MHGDFREYTIITDKNLFSSDYLHSPPQLNSSSSLNRFSLNNNEALKLYPQAFLIQLPWHVLSIVRVLLN